MSDLSVAESAFIGAVAKSMRTQAELRPLQERLAAEVRDAMRANEKVLQEHGITENTPQSEGLDLQDRLLELAIERSELGEDDPTVQQTRERAVQIRQFFEQEEQVQLGQIDGPVL